MCFVCVIHSMSAKQKSNHHDDSPRVACVVPNMNLLRACGNPRVYLSPSWIYQMLRRRQSSEHRAMSCFMCNAECNSRARCCFYFSGAARCTFFGSICRVCVSRKHMLLILFDSRQREKCVIYTLHKPTDIHNTH